MKINNTCQNTKFYFCKQYRFLLEQKHVKQYVTFSFFVDLQVILFLQTFCIFVLSFYTYASYMAAFSFNFQFTLLYSWFSWQWIVSISDSYVIFLQLSLLQSIITNK